MSLNVAVLTPSSRGNVTLASTSVQDNPLVSPNYLLAPSDQEVAVQAFKRAREVALATCITVGEEVISGPMVQSDEQILEYVKSVVGPIHHASATCAMVKEDDPAAVVSSVPCIATRSSAMTSATMMDLIGMAHG